MSDGGADGEGPGRADGEVPGRADGEAQGRADAHGKDPLHGLTLEAIMIRLVEDYGWEGLAERIPVRCFSSDPTIKSSLVFLRRTPWARAKVEALYLGKLQLRRPAGGRKRRP